ncbi:MAG: T9SS type A sorting domain-containing protein [Psychroflexus salarius]
MKAILLNKFFLSFVFVFLLISNIEIFAQSPISDITASYKSKPEDLNRYSDGSDTYSYDVGTDNDLEIESFSVGTKEYAIKTVPNRVVLRRVDNAFTTGQRDILFNETSPSGPSTFNLKSSYVSTMEDMLISNTINRGADNVFVNESTTNTNNIERIDFIFDEGISVPTNTSTQGFVILERGGNDSFKGAVITKLDVNGNPEEFTPVAQVTPSDFGASSINLATTVLNDGVGGELFESATVGSQTIEGSLFTFGDLGLTAGQTIYGYVLFANDVTATTNAEINDFTNATIYPRNTNSTNGGADLIAGGSVFVEAFIHNDTGWVDDPNLTTTNCDDFIVVTGGTTASLTKDMNVSNLILGNGAPLDLGTNTLSICEDIVVKNGSSNLSNGLINLNGSTKQQVIVSEDITADTLVVDQIELNNSLGLQIEANVDLNENLKLTNGNTTISTNSTFTFKSNATQTAVLSEVASGSTISGCVIVERYIPASNRAFRYTAASVNTTVTCGKETIKDNIQEGNSVSDYNNYTGTSETPGFGTHVTGSTVGANGFDATITGNPSMFSWDESTQQWGSVPNTDTQSFNVGDPYSLLVRGGRELDLTVNNSQLGTATTLRFTGELETGDVNVTNLASGLDEFSLVANPYQAQVDMKALLESADATNLNSTQIYIYDPTIGTRGAYVTVDLETTNGSPTPDSDANKFLQPNQAFFIQNTAASPSLTFKETYKKAVDQSLTNQTFSIEDNSVITANLKRAHNNSFKLVDGIKIMLNQNFDNTVLNNDAPKFWNSDESIAIEHNNNWLAVERRQIPETNESIQLFIWAYKNTDYQLELEIDNLEQTQVKLKDHYTNDIIELPTSQAFTYNFTANSSIPESVSNTRFELIFDEVSLSNAEITEQSISVYPNPATDLLHIDIPQIAGQEVTLELVDMAGRLISKETLTAQTNTISTKAVQNLKTGVYNVNIQFNNKNFNKKIIVN